MEVIVKKNYEEMSKAAATLFAAEIMENPKTILGMATGSTPVGLYKELDNLFNHVNINKENVHVPDGVGFEAGEAGKAYEELMAKTGQVEIQLLGLGCNGHIGFNEPADEFTKVTGEIDLTDSTIEANKRFFEKKEDVPRKAVSMGIGTIMRAKKIVLLVNGENKAEILKEVVNGPVTPKVPGSILQFHPHVTVICDEEAAKYL